MNMIKDFMDYSRPITKLFKHLLNYYDRKKFL